LPYGIGEFVRKGQEDKGRDRSFLINDDGKTLDKFKYTTKDSSSINLNLLIGQMCEAIQDLNTRLKDKEKTT